MAIIRGDLIAFSNITGNLLAFPPRQGSTVIPAGTSLPASGTLDFTVNVALPNAKVMSRSRIMLDGTGFSKLDGKWYVHQGYTRLTTTVAAVQYIVEVASARTSTTQKYNFRLTNNTAAPISLPAITLSAYARFLTYPWEP